MNSLCMSQSSISTAPFVCKWSGTHSEQQRFHTQKDLELHVNTDHDDLTKLEIFQQGRRFYICPWEGCKKQQNDIITLKEHLHKHTMQNPFKCPICNGSRQFRSLDTLNQHSINYHNFGIIDPTGANDMTNTTNCDEDMLYDKTTAKEQVYTEYKPTKLVTKAFNTTMPEISYAQIVKTGTALAKVKDDVDLKVHENEEEVDFFTKYHEIQSTAWELFCEAVKYEEESEYSEFDENVDELPDAPRDMEFMTKEEQDDAIWEAYCESHKGTKAVELMNKAFELLRNNR
ncbi:zinc finger protein GLIS2-like isoform X1 [Rhizophagus clarus]|nr:zinc finger protein GLIS2-like isoform X1 [Rhizophagus clarus]